MKRIKRFIILFLCLLLLNGCVKNDTRMTINKDKSMNLEVVILAKNEQKNRLSQTFNSSDLEKRGFKVTTTNENDDYSGYKVTKSFESIDELSYATDNVSDISTILDMNFDFSTLFSKKTDFFKETYTANFKYSVTNLQKEYSNDEDNTLEENYSESLSSINEMELKYTLVLPNKSISNNASEVSSDGKTLTWNLSNTADSVINYSFEIYNITHIAIVGGGALLLLIILIIIIRSIKKKKASEGTLVYKDPEPEVIVDNTIQEEKPTVEGETVVEDPNKPQVASVGNEGPMVLENLEFTLPEEETKNQINTATPENQFVQNNNVEMVQTAQDIGQLSESQLINNQTPNQEENVTISVNTFDYNRRPDFVRRDEPSKFVSATDEENPEEVSQTPVTNESSAPSLDIPNATALSDMDDLK